ncbi:DUF1622 domain-containing protein [Azospirillum halopraeferens]|uniref:DUF1622 domain-containing protein n=1 Tax=Azospirillum halopraeferens TaxID=34010 RepID=UPI0004215AE8|nr:DUF1622 domain-containing protein [Azospirillum halopraeferens]
MEPALSPARQAVKPDWFDPLLHVLATVFEGAGVLVITVGTLSALVLFALRLHRGDDRSDAFRRLRTGLARGILLGLELLVAADIIGTVAVRATVENLTTLALIVLIRTFLSFALEVEIDGRWPWRKAEVERRREAPAPPR